MTSARRGRRSDRTGAPVRRLLRVCVSALLLATLAGCGGGGARSGPEGTPRVLVSVPPEAYLVRSIAGARVSVEVLLPPGASPHTYEPSMGIARRAAEADLYLTVGHPRLTFETSWVAALKRVGGVPIVPLAATCDARPDDPHVWLSVACADTMARHAEAALERLLPASDSARLRARLDSTMADMHRASGKADSLLAPFSGRSFLVFHPAWGYFARDHRLRQLAVQAGSREPGPRDLARVLREIHEEGLRVLFIQPGMPRDEAERIARQLGVRTEVLDPLEENWPKLVRDAAAALAHAWSK
jgi:zinc transport system substrate-binding protein